jgi:hypothetical protein
MKNVRSEKAAHRSLEVAAHGRELSRPTGSLRPSDAAILAPVLHPSAARITLTDHSLRRGAEACASFASRAFLRGCARCNAADRRYPLANTRSKPTSTRFYPKSRSHTKHTTKPSLPGSRFAHRHARTSFANSLSNRELQLLEPTLIHRKQTIAPRSNRELSTNLCRANSHAVIPTKPFLTETASHSKMAVTHSKQTTAPFLTGARIGRQRRANSDAFLNPRIDSSSRLAQHGAHSK